MIKLISPLDQVDSSARFTVGSRTTTNDGNEYIYLPGIASCAQYDWVIYNRGTSSGTTKASYGSVTRINITTAGNAGIAQAAILGPKYGWFMIKGAGWGNAGAQVSSGSPIYASGTVGLVSTTVNAGNAVYNAFATQAGVSGGTCRVVINYPVIYGQVI